MAPPNNNQTVSSDNDVDTTTTTADTDGQEEGAKISQESTPLLSDGHIGTLSHVSSAAESGNGGSSVGNFTSSVRSAASDSLRKASSWLLQSMSSSQREHAMTLGVGPAAFLIKDAVIGQQDAPYEGWYDPYAMFGHEYDELRNLISVICGRMIATKWVKRTLCYLPNWTLFVLSFIEPPQWCRDSDLAIASGNPSDSLREYGDCNVILNAWGVTADGNETDQLYPNSNSTFLSVARSIQIESMCMGMVTVWMLLELGRDGMDLHLFFYKGAKRVLQSIRCCCLAGLLVGIIMGSTTFNPFLRMVLLASYLRTFQVELLSVARMIPQIVYILTVLAIVIIFYAWFGVVLFYGTEQGKKNFPNLIEGIWTLWGSVTTVNYPDYMMSAYNDNRLSDIFFVSYMVISFFYLMNLILAGVVNSYNENIEKRISDRKALANLLLTRAFEVMNPDKTGRVSREAIMAVFFILNEDFPQIRRMSKDEGNLIFGFLDRDGSSTITMDEFLDFGNVLLLEFTKESDYVTFVEKHLPKVFRSRGWQEVCKFAHSIAFEYCIDLILVANAVIIAIQSYPELSGQDVAMDPHYNDGYIDTIWELMETIFTALYMMEVIIKVLVDGWKKYSESPRNMFDFSVTLMAVLATIYVYYPNAYSDSRLIRFIVMARVLRLLRLLFAYKAFEMVGIISIDIIPAASNVVLILLFLMYSFAAVGTLLYGGLITRDPANPLAYVLLEADDFVDNAYWANNFNDMISGMNVLFNLLVVNNWTTQEVAFEMLVGKSVRFFFFFFHLFGVVVINNVVIAFIINAFFQQLKTVVGRHGWEETVADEAVISGARARFRASKITGTDTGVVGGYIARVRPRHMDVEVDERVALRRLFTRTSTNEGSIPE